jgi:hypothetical protein
VPSYSAHVSRALNMRDTQPGALWSPGLFVNCSPAVDTHAAIAMKRASARSPGSSEMMKVTAVPVRV